MRAKQPQVLKLRATVSFAKRMGIVDVADYRGGSTRKNRGFAAMKIFFRHDTPMHVGHARLDILAKLELIAALADLDGSNFPGPIVHVLEQVPVYGPKMRHVEIPERDSFHYPVCYKAALLVFKRIQIADI